MALGELVLSAAEWVAVHPAKIPLPSARSRWLFSGVPGHVFVPTTLSFSRPRALVLVALVWGAIYLPALGSLEIKGEEGRRILPAVAMLETGNWIVPHVGGEPYLSKPPLINWLIAGSFKIFGVQDEWAARQPSVLAVLALALGIAWRGSAWLGPGGGLLAAIFTLTNVGLMEKGRLAEIEALYVACFGLALVDWLAAWRLGESPWRRWLLPAFFLGLGLLTKGPLHVLFFYAIVGAILWRAGRLRAELAHPAHFVGVALMLGMFAAWAVPYWLALPHNQVGSAWSAQFTGRMKADSGFRFKNWIQNIPRGLFNFIPWAVFLPLLWRRANRRALPARYPREHAILYGGRLAMVGCFLLVSLLPGGLPRYTLPLIVPAALLLARVIAMPRALFFGFAGMPGAWRKGWKITVQLFLNVVGVPFGIIFTSVIFSNETSKFYDLAHGGTGEYVGTDFSVISHQVATLAAATFLPMILWMIAGKGWGIWGWRPRVKISPQNLAKLSAGIMATVVLYFVAAVVPNLSQHSRLRTIGFQLTDAAGARSILALAPGYQPFLFYLYPSPRYVSSMDQLKAEDVAPGASLLVKGADLSRTVQQLSARDIPWQTALTLDEKNRGRYVLLRLGGTKPDKP